MPLIAIVFGAALTALGYIGYQSPSTLGVTDQKPSPTALIPAAFGVILILSGLVGLVSSKARKHVMHLAAMVGLLGTAGGFMPMRRGGFDFDKPSVMSGLILTIFSAIFLFLCIRSFVRARIARQVVAKRGT